ncbi:hypothetical protein [Dactylosporangium sp. CA-092794]|uniref:hypothetical protein n=1 Tax=Dactylosporangium sp. CA-092794 TaxID=3239929 RepID=UPI003D8FB7FB
MDTASRHLATRLLRRAGLWSWRPDAPVADAWGPIMVGDVVFPSARLVVDFGSSSYTDPVDRARLRLRASGWTLATYSPTDLQRRPVTVGREIRALLDHLTPTRYP